jgi:hypothetical protein
MRHPVALLLDFCPALLHRKASREEKKKKKKNTTTNNNNNKPSRFLHQVALFLNSTDYPYTQQACNCFLHSASTQLIRVLFPRTTRPPSPSPFYNVLSRYSTKKSTLPPPPFIQQLHPPATTAERELEKAQSSIDEGIG